LRRGLVVALLLTGCSLVNAPSDHAAAPVEADEFCEQLTSILCDGVIGCCGAATGFPRDDCVTRLNPFCTSTYGPLISDGRTGYDAEEAGYRLARLLQMTRECSTEIAAELSSEDGLFALLTGTVGQGGTCNPTIMERPEMDVFDSPRFLSCIGTLQCSFVADTSDWRCLPPVANGAPCSASALCEPGSICVAISDTEARCMDRFADGAPCASSAACGSYVCGACDTAGNNCTCRPDDTAEQVYCALLNR